MRVLGLCVVLAFATLSSSARAEKVKSNQPAKLLNHPGEQGKVLLKIKEGQNMTVLAKEGRWLKVRVSGRTGYVPRSKVDMASDDDLVRNTRRRAFVDGRGTSRGFGSQEGPEDRVGADATETSGGKPVEDDEDKPKGKKPADDDEDKPKGKAHKASDDDEDKPKAHKGKKPADEDEDKPKAHKGKKPVEDEDEDKPKGKKGKKPVDDEDVVASEDDDKATEDAPEKEDVRPMAHVGTKTKIFSERDKESEVAFTAKSSDTLYPVDTKGKWTMVETEEGDSGWVQTSSLDLEDGGGGGGIAHKRSIDLHAGLGVSFIQQGMRTAGTTIMGTDQVPDVYNIGTSAATIDLGGRVLFPYGKKYMFGAELLFDASKTLLGGVNYKATTTGLTVTDFNLRGVFAYPTQRKSGLTILARLGFRYRGYLVDDYADPAKNPAKIPQETLKAPTLGAALVLPTLTDKVGLQFGFDAILFGSSISQTEGLEDGMAPSMSGVHVNVGLVYRWKKDMNLQGGYDLDYASYDFGAMSTVSTRGHTAPNASRTDIMHTVSFGIAKGF